ncbi:MAG: hypothetical protein JWQ74_1236 [Marmoricola sp.]|nr:hypothetical protein [Marmoricola sp.]
MARKLKTYTRYGIAVFAIYSDGRYAKAGAYARTAIARVSGLKTSQIQKTTLRLSWTNPRSKYLSGVTIRRSRGTQAPTSGAIGSVVANLSKSAKTFVDKSLSQGTKYTYAVFAKGPSGVPSDGAIARVTTRGTPDTKAPNPVTGVSTTLSPTSVVLAWSNPTDADLSGITIRRATGATPPVKLTDGALVIEDSPTARTFTNRQLVAGSTYSFSLFAHDAAGNSAVPATVTITLPLLGETDGGVSLKSSTIQPAASSIQSVTGDSDGSQTIAIGLPESPSARLDSNDRRVAAGVGGGANPCVIYGITNPAGQLRAYGLVALPSASLEYGSMRVLTGARPSVSGLQCLAAGTPASIDQAYSSFDKDMNGLKIGTRFGGDKSVDQKTKLGFGCTAKSGGKASVSADFSDFTADVKIKLDVRNPQNSKLSYNFKATPKFTLGFSGATTIQCETPKDSLGVYIPLAGTPLMFKIAPAAHFTVTTSSAKAALKFAPTFSLSSKQGGSISAPIPQYEGSVTDGGSFEAGLGVAVSLLIGGPAQAGLTGTVGPTVQLPVQNGKFGCGSFAIEASIQAVAKFLFTNWHADITNGKFGSKRFGVCPIEIITTTLPSANRGSPYSAQLTTQDHRVGSWRVTGSLPPGLTLSGYTISGTPTSQGQFSFGLTFTDEDGNEATATGSIFVGPKVPCSVGFTAAEYRYPLGNTVTFTTPDQRNHLSSYSEYLTWGDGGRSVTIGVTGGSTEAHTYAGRGSYTVTQYEVGTLLNGAQCEGTSTAAITIY